MTTGSTVTEAVDLAYAAVNRAFPSGLASMSGFGEAGVSGHLTSGSTKQLFLALSNLLRESKESWQDQHFIDLGVGEGYIFYVAALLGIPYVTGIDLNETALYTSSQVLKRNPSLVAKIPNSSQLKWCFGDILYLPEASLQGITMVYSFSLVFPAEVVWKILVLFSRSTTTRTLILPLRPIRNAINLILKPKPYQQVYLEEGDIELAQSWDKLIKGQQTKTQLLATRKRKGIPEEGIPSIPSLSLTLSGAGERVTFLLVRKEMLDFKALPVTRVPKAPFNIDNALYCFEASVPSETIQSELRGARHRYLEFQKELDQSLKEEKQEKKKRPQQPQPHETILSEPKALQRPPKTAIPKAPRGALEPQERNNPFREFRYHPILGRLVAREMIPSCTAFPVPKNVSSLYGKILFKHAKEDQGNIQQYKKYFITSKDIGVGDILQLHQPPQGKKSWTKSAIACDIEDLG